MRKNEKERTLYFSDEEIDNETQGEKKVFVTKRINGKESHVKINKEKRENKKSNKEKEVFDFNDEIVIGVNIIEDEEKESKNNKKKQKSKLNQKKKVTTKNKAAKTNKKTRKKRKTGIFSIIILIIIVGILICMAPIFNVSEIEIKGNNKVSVENIINLSGIKKGENIFKYKKNKVISNIKENAYIDSVKIKIVLPKKIILDITERDISYQLNCINSWVYIDKYGYILECSSTKQEVPTIVGLEVKEDELLENKRLADGDLKKLNEVSKIMEALKTINLMNIVTEINAQNENDYIIHIDKEVKKIQIGNTSNLSNKVLYIKKIMENEVGKSGTIFVNGDISSGFKPYFREE